MSQMSAKQMKLEDWLTELDQGIHNAPLFHPRIKDFAELVAKRTKELRFEQANHKGHGSSIVNIEDRSRPQSP